MNCRTTENVGAGEIKNFRKMSLLDARRRKMMTEPSNKIFFRDFHAKVTYMNMCMRKVMYVHS